MAQGQINDQEERECEESLLSPDWQHMSVSDCATQPDSENNCSVTISSPRNSAPIHNSSPEAEFFVIPKDVFTGLTESLWAFEKCSADLTSSVPPLPAPPNVLPNVPTEVLPSPLLPHHHLRHATSPQPQVPHPLSLGVLKPNLVVRPPIVIPHIPPAHRKPHAEHYRIYRPHPNNNCKKCCTDASPYDTSISPHNFPANEYSSISPVDGAPNCLPYGLAVAYYSSSSHYADAMPVLNGPTIHADPNDHFPPATTWHPAFPKLGHAHGGHRPHGLQGHRYGPHDHGQGHGHGHGLHSGSDGHRHGNRPYV
ncbi:hypothetical protein BU17DRAFT_102166 [Hysterangium stoloniferum]|nr:hypothetical protein BU17DRAFT_102166 [Hysterangium stoloniferum]